MKTLIIASVMLSTMKMYAQSETAIRYEDGYSVYITRDLKTSKDFYVRWLDFEIVFESSWFVFMQSKGKHPVSFALIDEKHPSSPPSYPAFNGRGSYLRR